MAAPEEEWYTKLSKETKSIEDAPFVIEWYSKSKDRSRNPFQLRGFGDSIRNIIGLLIENMNLLMVPDDDRNAFVEAFRKHLKANPGLNKDDDALPKILEFYFKSGDYNLLMPTGQNMLDLFCGYARNATDIQFDTFYNHFDGVGKKVLETIELPKYFYFGLNDDPAYVFFRRSHDPAFFQSEITKPDDKNISPYFFMKQINQIFDKKTTDDLNEAKLQFDENKDKNSFEFMYKLQVEKVFIKIVIAMIDHVTKYYLDKSFTDEHGSGDPDIKQDTHVSDLVSKLLKVLMIHVNINSFVNSTVQYNGFARAYQYITNPKNNNFGNSKTEQLKALEVFYKKLQKVRDFDSPVSLGDFWDKFDSVVINADFEQKTNFRSYMYRSDFDPSAILIQGVSIDSQVVLELDNLIKASEKYNFSSVIDIFMNKEFMFWFFFKHLREIFGYLLETSLSPRRGFYIETAAKQELAVKRGEPIPSPEPYEEQWAEEVPRPLIPGDLTTQEDFNLAVSDFKAKVKRFIGNKQIKEFLETFDGILNSGGVLSIEAKKQNLATLMKTYVSLRPALVKYIGQPRKMAIPGRDQVFAVDNSDGNLYFSVIYQMKESFLKTDENLVPNYNSAGKIAETPIPTQVSTRILDRFLELGEYLALFNTKSPAATEFTLDGLNNFFFTTFLVGDQLEFYTFDKDSRLFRISNNTGVFLTPPIAAGTKIFKQRTKDSLNVFYKRPDTHILRVTITPGKPEEYTDFVSPNEVDALVVKDVKVNFEGKWIQLYSYGSKHFLTIEKADHTAADFILPNLPNVEYKSVIPDPNADVYFLIGFDNTNPSSTPIYRFIPGSEPTLIAKLPNAVNSIVYQDTKKRFVSVDNNKQIVVTKIVESAIDEPLDQPDLPESHGQIVTWWDNVKGLDAQRKDQFVLALDTVKDVVDPEIYENMLEMLSYGMRPAEFRNIYLPMLIELYKLKENTPKADEEAAVGAAEEEAGGGNENNALGGGRVNANYNAAGGSRNTKNNNLQSFIEAFINGSTKNPGMKANLQAIANSPSEDYKSKIVYEVEKPNNTLLAKYFS